MNFKFVHNNINVLNLEKSLAFYKSALNLVETKRKNASDDSFTLVFLADSLASEHLLELTYIKNKNTPYNLGDNEIHLAFRVDDFESAYNHHKNMGVICFENKDMGIYFISDPDGYWIEILPTR